MSVSMMVCGILVTSVPTTTKTSETLTHICKHMWKAINCMDANTVASAFALVLSTGDTKTVVVHFLCWLVLTRLPSKKLVDWMSCLLLLFC